jgi:hypothetical protein
MISDNNDKENDWWNLSDSECALGNKKNKDRFLPIVNTSATRQM